jgi:hypothetical protein
VDSRRESLLLSDSPEQFRELLALRFAEGRQKTFLMFTCNSTDLLQNGVSLVRQVKRVLSPVLGVRTALDQGTLFEAIEHRNEPAGMNAEFRGKFLLARSGGNLQKAQDAGVGRRKCQGRKPFGKPRRRVSTNLSKQKSRLVAGFLRVFHTRLRKLLHIIIV